MREHDGTERTVCYWNIPDVIPCEADEEAAQHDWSQRRAVAPELPEWEQLTREHRVQQAGLWARKREMMTAGTLWAPRETNRSIVRDGGLYPLVRR